MSFGFLSVTAPRISCSTHEPSGSDTDRAAGRGILFETTHRVVSIPLRGTEAYLPPPGFHQLTYHGVLAGGSTMRDAIVPGSRAKRSQLGPDGGGDGPINRYLYAELMQRVFGVDVLRCNKCESRRELIALIIDPEVIERILKCLGFPHRPPPIAAARPPPQLEFGY